MKNFAFDIQRFEDWATIISGEGTTTLEESITIASGTDNAETIQVPTINQTIRAVYGNGGNDIISIEGSMYGVAFSTVTVDGGDGDDKIIIHADNDTGIDISKVTITGGAGNDVISISGGQYGIGGVDGAGGSTVSIDSGDGADIIFINSIDSISSVSIVAGAGDSISVGSGAANYFFDSTDAVTINGATFTASNANTSADLVSYTEGTSIGSAWTGTVALSGTNSLADLEGSIVSAAGSYQIVDGKFAGTVEPARTNTNSSGRKIDIVFLIDNTGSMSGYIASVKSAVSGFAQDLSNSNLNCRYGLVEFGDINDSSIKTYEFTDDVENFVSNVDNISLTDGGDGPESGLEAIMNGALAMNFDSDANKRFILISDASFHNSGESGDGDSSAYLVTSDVATALKENSVTMDVVGSAGYCRSEWEPLANYTDGKFYLLGEGFPSIFQSIVADMVNVVDLNLVPENQTGFFVALGDTDTISTPLFQVDGASTNDTAVGSVDEPFLYVADDDSDSGQKIIIPSNWNVIATKNDDKLIISGETATVTGGDGEDIFSLGTDTKSVSLMDLDVSDDKLSFSNYIEHGSMRQSIEDDHLVLTADELRIDLPAMDGMTDKFLNYSVSNAGETATIRDLIYGNCRVMFSSFQHTFTPYPSEDFKFF